MKRVILLGMVSIMIMVSCKQKEEVVKEEVIVTPAPPPEKIIVPAPPPPPPAPLPEKGTSVRVDREGVDIEVKK
ncbi:hypothetical protein [Flavobacterium sp. GT3R68]|uniref:hypothetical protein n=1 Tax=Flavobacterium sp. GT3R68 TaxID=2594437 RepID=UPI000F875961|nr:hypothetical protein [Flavobacterium sp. GT3R68]RTY89809.1 hypothetical protein EKL32_21880 [Flavobacterium sp. GSN2]TRW89788.1 hypothetical protein FNW07_12110 [Flavobacterium sp. GT3R68]